MKKICLVTVDGFFGQSIPTEKSMDLGKLRHYLAARDFEVEFSDIEAIANDALDLNTWYVFGSHQNPDIKAYIDDVVAFRFGLEGFHSVPSPSMILAHENKGVQSMLAKSLNIDLNEQTYHIRPKMDLTETVVVKLVEGAGSNGVFLLQPNENMRRGFLRASYQSVNLAHVFFRLKTEVKKLLKYKTYSLDHEKYNDKYWRHVIQKLLRSPGYDFKVLIFFDKVFALRRGNRKNDFRSSGSGLFDFVEPDEQLIAESLSIREKLDVPYVSLDMLKTESGYKCLEFQCVHFGPYTQMYAKKYYEIHAGKCIDFENVWSLEELIGYSLSAYLNKEA